VLLFCDLAKQINQDLIRLPSLRRKARDDVAEVRTVERRVVVDVAREEPLTKGTERDEPDSKFLEPPAAILLQGVATTASIRSGRL
jgi:hypothetical protein